MRKDMHVLQHTQQHVIVIMYRLGGIYMHRRMFSLSKSKQMSWLSVQLSGISKRYGAMPYIVFCLLSPYVLKRLPKKVVRRAALMGDLERSDVSKSLYAGSSNSLSGAQGLREWVEWHRSMGVGRFYIMDYNSSKPTGREIADHTSSGLVDLFYRCLP